MHRFEVHRVRRTELGKSHLERREHEERERWATLSQKDKAAEWAAEHQLSVIMGSWATTMVVAGSVILRDPYVFSFSESVNRQLPHGLTWSLYGTVVC